MLDDFPQDEGLAFPISPVNSVLDALASLPRPSPSPTPSKLEFTWSSGDIPLILYDNAYVDGRVSGLFTSGKNKRDSIMTLGNNTNHCFSHHSQRFSTSSRASLIDRHRESVMMSSSVSSDTIRSAATFGTRKQSTFSTTGTRHPRQPTGDDPSHTSESTITEDCETGEVLLDDTRVFQGKVSRSVSTHSDTPVTSRADDMQRSNIGEWYSVSSLERAGTPSGESTCVEPPSSATRASIFLEGSGVGSGDMKTSPSAQTWFSVSEWDYRDRTALDPTTSGLFKRTSLASDDITVTDSELMHHTPPAGGSKPNLEPMRFQPSHIPESVQYHQEALSPLRTSDSAHHGFLRATSVQFLIDQEGFRDAEPSFKFCGISRVRSSGDDRTQDKIMARFRPLSRQQFHFHHAPFESPPILRRITVNNDDVSDYVSRQAHLTLKSNGVYVIHGHEILSAEQASEQTKLYWQFEYLVDDRRVESPSGSRRHLEGEKTFTPLTFSCSPRLLLPSQAKRIGIMHVFKKSLAPKLVAEKLQVRLGTDRSASSPLPDKSPPPTASDHRTSHFPNRRSRGAGHEAPSKRAVSVHVSLLGPIQNGYEAGSTTSFGQESLSRFSTYIPSSPEAKGDDRNGTNAIDANHPAFLRGSPAVDRHIVPPARLSELLIQQDSSSKDSEGYAAGRVTPRNSGDRASSFLDTSERDSNTFVALTPRPKRPTSFENYVI